MKSMGWPEGRPLLNGDVINGNHLFFDTNLADGRYVALTRLPTDTRDATQWTMDLTGRIHPTATPWQCLALAGERLGLSPCRNDDAGQRWQYREDIEQLRNEGNGRCLDHAHHNTTLITYGCTGNWNQKWNGVAMSDNRLLSLLDGPLLFEVYGVLLGD